MSVEQRSVMQIEREDTTPVMGNTVEGEASAHEDGDIPVSEVPGAGILGNGDLDQMNTFPMVLPENPTFSVPPNPLLSEGYNEILDYNSVQYLNGIFRTQIGRYVRIQQLVGSNITEYYEGFLIGVGINYIILQDYLSGNIRILDIYGIKSMYVYYSELVNPYEVAN